MTRARRPSPGTDTRQPEWRQLGYELAGHPVEAMTPPCPHCGAPFSEFGMRRAGRRHIRRCTRATAEEREHWKRTGRWPASPAQRARNRLCTLRWKLERRAERPVV